MDKPFLRSLEPVLARRYALCWLDNAVHNAPKEYSASVTIHYHRDRLREELELVRASGNTDMATALMALDKLISSKCDDYLDKTLGIFSVDGVAVQESALGPRERFLAKVLLPFHNEYVPVLHYNAALALESHLGTHYADAPWTDYVFSEEELMDDNIRTAIKYLRTRKVSLISIINMDPLSYYTDQLVHHGEAYAKDYAALLQQLRHVVPDLYTLVYEDDEYDQPYRLAIVASICQQMVEQIPVPPLPDRYQNAFDKADLVADILTWR